MIRYSLRCTSCGHGFDGWFRSAEGFDALRQAGQVGCAMNWVNAQLGFRDAGQSAIWEQDFSVV